MFNLRDGPTAVILIFLVIIVVGEVTLYGVNPYHMSVDVTRDGDIATYSFDTNVNITYSCVSMDNSSNTVDTYVAYYDEQYSGAYYRPDVYNSLIYLKQCLAKFSITLEIVGTQELTDIINTPDTSKAIIISTGTLPYTVYAGNAADPIFDWLSAGGYMYWIGSAIGSEYFDENKAKHVVSNPDTLFFGAEGVIRERVDETEGSIFDNSLVSGSITDITHQYYNECTFGVDVTKLITPYVALDYNYEGYHATTFTKYYAGTGTIVVFGGGLNKYMVGPDVAQPVAQTIASRMTYDTILIDHVESRNAKGTTGVIHCASGPTDVFVFVSTGDVVYGKNVRV